jgi:NAD(P)-dependent dehydrogenase (short-subunit alcohol dehydrogenase family)
MEVGPRGRTHGEQTGGSGEAGELSVLAKTANQVAAVAVAERELAEAIARRLKRSHVTVESIEPPPPNSAMEPAYFRDAAEKIAAAYGRLDIWVQSAHTEILGASAEIGLDTWWKALAGSVGAAFAGAQAAGRFMRGRGGGSLVMITSVDGLLSSAGRAAPSCGAAAIIALARTLACEWAPVGIRVNAIATTAWLDSPRGLEGVETTAAGLSPTRIPLGRPVRADEVAEAVTYLASSESSFVTGETLRLDGGWTGYQLF